MAANRGTSILRGGLSDQVWRQPIMQAYAREGSHGWVHDTTARTLEHDKALERLLRLPPCRFNDEQIAKLLCSATGRHLADAAHGRTPGEFTTIVNAWMKNAGFLAGLRAEANTLEA